MSMFDVARDAVGRFVGSARTAPETVDPVRAAISDATHCHWWGVNVHNRADVERSARRALWAADVPQTIHTHSVRERCVAGECITLRRVQ